MPNILLIEKTRRSRFEFTLNNEETVTDSAPALTTIGDFFNFKTKNGAYLIKSQQIRFSEIIVRDTYGGAEDYTAINTASLLDKLTEIGFFPDRIESTGAGRFDELADTFNYSDNDGKAIVVDERLRKLVPVELYNINKLSGLFDVDIENAYEDQVLRFKQVNDQLVVVPSYEKETTGQGFNAVGSFIYEDSKAVSLNYTGGELQLLNNSEGAGTFVSEAPYGVPEIWDEETSVFDFSRLSEGDRVFVKVRLSHVTTQVNQVSSLQILGIENSGEAVRIDFEEDVSEQTGMNILEKSVSFSIRDSWKNNAAILNYTSSSNSTITVDLFDFYVIRKSINIIDVNGDNFRTFKVSQIRLNLSDETTSNGFVKLSYNDNGAIDSILFDAMFSTYIQGFADIQNAKNLELKIYNKTKSTTQSAKILSISYSNIDNRYYRALLDTVIGSTSISQHDKLEINIDISSASEATSSSSTKDYFVADGIETLFSLTSDADNIDAYVDTVYQEEVETYSFSNNQITFVEPPEDGAVIWVRKYSSSSQKEEFTATEGQTVFVLSSVPNSTDVYVDTVYQQEKAEAIQQQQIDYERQGNQIITQFPVEAGSKVIVRKF